MNPEFKLGKLLPEFDPKTLLLSNYLKKGLAAPPASIDWAKKVPTWPMFGNNQYGDCTCAAAGHMIEEWTANTTTEKILPESAILDAYNYFAHGNPDAGASMLAVLKYWSATGIGGDHIEGYAQLELKNTTEVQDAVSLFGNCYIGVMLPNFAVVPGQMLQTPWVVPPSGPVGNAAPNPNNGHCIPAVAYDARNLWVVTWGALKSMSWQFYTTYADEAFAVLSPDWFKKGRAPSGLDLQALKSDLAAIKSAQGG